VTPRKPDPAPSVSPYVSDEVRLITIGTMAWVAAGIIFAISGAKADRLWMCLVGALLGVNGIRIAIKRRKRQAT